MEVPQLRMTRIWVIHLRTWEGLPEEGAAGGQAEGRTDTFSVEEMLVQRPWSRREVGALEMLNKARVGRRQRRQSNWEIKLENLPALDHAALAGLVMSLLESKLQGWPRFGAEY